MGSIVAPSSRASVVGMKPTLGLVSRDRVLPISDECDSAGPIGRTVTDVAVMLTAMAATRDIRDRLSQPAAKGFTAQTSRPRCWIPAHCAASGSA